MFLGTSAFSEVHASKTAQDCSKRAPRGLQNGSQTAPRRPKTAQESPRRPKIVPRWLQDASTLPQDGPKTRQDAPREAQRDPTTTQDGPRRGQKVPTIPPPDFVSGNYALWAILGRFWARFGSDFGTILGPCRASSGAPTTAQERTQWAPIWSC